MKKLIMILIIIIATLNLLYTFGYQGEPMSQLEFLTRTLGSIAVILGGLFLLIKKLKWRRYTYVLDDIKQYHKVM